MLVAQSRAPSFEELRPFKPATTDGFPVYPRLVDDLLAARNIAGPNWQIAHVLGTCAGYAYSEEMTIRTIMARMGLEENYCVKIGEYVDAMFICSTAFIIQSKCGRVALLCYRGTEPTNIINWLTDVEVDPDMIALDMGGMRAFGVHAGFYRNVRATRWEVLNALERALEGKPLVPGAPEPEHALEALYVTGHSLGGAMAALMGVMLSSDPRYERLKGKVRAIYTFGQPMIGTPELASACDADPFLEKRMARFVYGHDLVPALPPTMAGPFGHFGPEYRCVSSVFGKKARWCEAAQTRQLSSPLDVPLALVAFITRQLARFRRLPFPYSMGDHGPQHYVSALTSVNGVPSEFGDDAPPPRKALAGKVLSFPPGPSGAAARSARSRPANRAPARRTGVTRGAK
jgi:hypothetical protein